MTATRRAPTPPPARQRWTPRKAGRRAGEVLRREGLRSLWFRVLGETVYRRMIVVEGSVGRPPAEVRSGIADFRRLEVAEVEEYLRFRPDTGRAEVEDRLGNGQACFVARQGGDMVQACWVAASSVWIDYLERELALAPDELYAYDFFTAPDARGHNLYRAQVSAMFRYYHGYERHRILALFNPENRTWLVFKRLGFQPTGIAGYVGAGPWRLHFHRRNSASAERLAARADAGRRRRRRRAGGIGTAARAAGHRRASI